MLFLSKPFIDELLWEEAVALWAQLTASLRKNTGQREMRNAKPCLQLGSPVPAPSKTSEAVFVAGIMGSKQVRGVGGRESPCLHVSKAYTFQSE